MRTTERRRKRRRRSQSRYLSPPKRLGCIMPPRVKLVRVIVVVVVW